jgi:predicted nucleic acid-binding protein
LRRSERLVVDANAILSALIGGATGRVFANPAIKEFATTEFTLAEFLPYLSVLSQKSGVSEDELRTALYLLPLTVHERAFYEKSVAEATRQIGARDPNDVDILALALRLKAPIWSNDEDLAGLGVEVLTTAKLLCALSPRSAK